MSESVRAMNALGNFGGPGEFVVYEDESHGFQKNESKVAALKKRTPFWRKSEKGPEHSFIQRSAGLLTSFPAFSLSPESHQSVDRVRHYHRVPSSSRLRRSS